MRIYPNNRAVAHEQAGLELAEARLTRYEHALAVMRDDVRLARQAVKRAREALRRAKKLPAPKEAT